jgi:hypothetical protein
MVMKNLVLNLKGEYFDQIKDRIKVWEYRLLTPYWEKRLMDGNKYKKFDKVIIKRGYPKRDDHTRQLVRKFITIRRETITHPHFGSEPVKVFCIWVDAVPGLTLS